MNQNDSLTERYERMRGALLDREQPVAIWGFAVLRTKGMGAWVKSWQEYGQDKAKHRSARLPEAAGSRLSPASEEVVQVLAEMVWAIHQEAVS